MKLAPQKVIVYQIEGESLLDSVDVDIPLDIVDRYDAITAEYDKIQLELSKLYFNSKIR